MPSKHTETISTAYRNPDIVSMPAELLAGLGWDRNALLSTKQHFYCTHLASYLDFGWHESGLIVFCFWISHVQNMRKFCKKAKNRKKNPTPQNPANALLRLNIYQSTGLSHCTCNRNILFIKCKMFNS